MRHSPMNWLHITSEVRISAKLQKLCRGVYPAFGCAQDSLSSAVLGRYLPSVRFDTWAEDRSLHVRAEHCDIKRGT